MVFRSSVTGGRGECKEISRQLRNVHAMKLYFKNFEIYRNNSIYLFYFIFLERPRSPWEVHAEPLGLRGAQVGNLWSKVIPRQTSLVHIKTDRKQQENMEYFKYFGNITNEANCKREIKSRIVKRRAAFNNSSSSSNNNNKQQESFHQQIGLNITK